MRSAPIVFAIFGLGLGVLLLRPKTRDPMSLRERAIEAQKTSARASQLARDLAAQWSAMEHRS